VVPEYWEAHRAPPGDWVSNAAPGVGHRLGWTGTEPHHNSALGKAPARQVHLLLLRTPIVMPVAGYYGMHRLAGSLGREELRICNVAALHGWTRMMD
jgi:hypothetical protein